MRWLLSLLTLLTLTFAAQAEEEIVLGLSQDQVAITAQFDGSDILIFGAVKREIAIPDSDLNVIIAIEGPTGPVEVRRKERRFGIWMNGATLEVERAPAFYAVAASAPLDDILRRIENERYSITVDKAIQSVNKYLLRDGNVVADMATTIAVRKVGLERFLFNLAQDQAPVYGVLSILIAALFGWAASALFRLIKDG